MAQQPRFSFTAGELVGSLGDLGTLLPLTLGLIVYNGISPMRALLLLGVTYGFTGLFYGLPVPVQPLKATAMIAIATGASRTQIAAAALWIAGILLILCLTRAIDKLNDIFPRLLVRGLQFGLGLLMIRTGAKFVLNSRSDLLGTLSGVYAAAAGTFPSASDFRASLVLLVLPQIPLTLGNSVIATRDCARKYFAHDGERVTPGRLALTIALGNAAAGLFGGIPMCHGAGGMTAHYRLGARSGAAGVMMGTMLLIAGVAARESLPLIYSIPAAVLGALLLYVGVRHALLAGGELRRLKTAAVVVTMGGVAYLNANMLFALIAGMLVKAAVLDVPLLLQRRRLGPK